MFPICCRLQWTEEPASPLPSGRAIQGWLCSVSCLGACFGRGLPNLETRFQNNDHMFKLGEKPLLHVAAIQCSDTKRP